MFKPINYWITFSFRNPHIDAYWPNNSLGLTPQYGGVVAGAEDSNPGYMVWLNYFRSIKHVCPWSYKSFIAGTTNIVPYDPEILVLNEINWGTEPWEVIIYLVGDDLTLEEIDKIVESRNNLQNKCEYLWSHPSFTKGGNNQTPVAVIIQQDRQRLEELRNG